jgi:hypothetical protein
MMFYRLSNNNKTDQGDGGFEREGLIKEILEKECAKELYLV